MRSARERHASVGSRGRGFSWSSSSSSEAVATAFTAESLRRATDFFDRGENFSKFVHFGAEANLEEVQAPSGVGVRSEVSPGKATLHPGTNFFRTLAMKPLKFIVTGDMRRAFRRRVGPKRRTNTAVARQTHLVDG